MNEFHLVVRLWLSDEADTGEFEELERAAARLMAKHGGRIERAFRRDGMQQ